MVSQFDHASASSPALLDVDQSGRPAAASAGQGDDREMDSQSRHPPYDDLTGDTEPAVRSNSLTSAHPYGFRRHRLPISEVVEPAPFVDRSCRNCGNENRRGRTGCSCWLAV